MSDLSAMGAFLLNCFKSIWTFLFSSAGWVGLAVLGFFVIRLVILAIGFLLSHSDKKSN